MQLLTHAWDTCFWHQKLHMYHQVSVDGLIVSAAITFGYRARTTDVRGLCTLARVQCLHELLISCAVNNMTSVVMLIRSTCFDLDWWKTIADICNQSAKTTKAIYFGYFVQLIVLKKHCADLWRPFHLSVPFETWVVLKSTYLGHSVDGFNCTRLE